MNLNEIRFNSVFEYIKDIRRYSYDIEEFLKKENLCDTVNQTPPFPDEFEPTLERLSFVKNYEDKVCTIGISQASISILFRFINENIPLDRMDNEINELKIIIDKIVSFMKQKISNYKIDFEGVVVASSKIEKLSTDITVLKVDDKTDELRERVARELDDKYILIEENSVLKSYKLISQVFNPLAIKNKKENFIGWSVILFKELNNRLIYNYNELDNDNRLNISEVIKTLNEKFKRDTK
jgi:hypothetical protein